MILAKRWSVSALCEGCLSPLFTVNPLMNRYHLMLLESEFGCPFYNIQQRISHDSGNSRLDPNADNAGRVVQFNDLLSVRVYRVANFWNIGGDFPWELKGINGK